MSLLAIWMMNTRIGLILYKEALTEWAKTISKAFDKKQP